MVAHQFWTRRPANAEEAISAFKTQSKTLASVSPGESPLIARREPFSQALERVDDTLTERERRELIRYGTLDDLRREGDCWAVESSGSFGNGIIGYLDAETGLLVFVWIVPEG